jgi:hypothetical protein
MLRHAMRTLLFALSLFTGAASGWLIVMYFTLQHPGFESGAAVAALFAVQSALTIVALSGIVDGRWLKPLLLAGAVGIMVAGVSAVRADLASPHFEGFVLVIGAALAVQGVLTLAVLLRGSIAPALR